MTQAAKVVWGTLGVAVLLVVAVAINIFLVKLSWNHGVAPVAGVGGVNFSESFWITLGLATVGGLLRGPKR